MPTGIRSATAAAFDSAGAPLSDSALEEAERIAASASLSPSDLVCKWEAWSSSRNRPKGSPSVVELSAFAESLKRRLPSSAKKPSFDKPLTHHVGPPAPVLKIDDFFSAFSAFDNLSPKQADGDDGDAVLPDVAVADPTPAPSPDARRTSVIVGGAALGGPADVVLPADDDDGIGAAFTARSDAGKVIIKYNHSPAPSTAARGGVRVKPLPKYVHDDPNNPFTYMNDDLDGAADWIRGRMRAVGERILARRAAELVHGGLEDPARPPAPDAFFAPSPNVVLAVGRVRVELDGGAGRINASSVVLESEDGNLLKLNLGRVKAMKRPLFLSPGMIAVVEGINTNGRLFDVHAIYDNSIPFTDTPSPANPPASPPIARCLVAAGPFTLPGNLKYDPLGSLLAHVVASKPDVVVLLGPFVDSSHNLVNECLPIEFSALFESRVLKRISAAAEQTPGTSVVLVPAVSDAHHEFVCPQPAFMIGGRSGTSPSVQFASNPTAVVVSDNSGSKSAVLGLTSLPTVVDTSGDCICSDTGDRLTSLASHMVRQWSFYPPFPASAGVPLDTSNADLLELPDCGVDVLVAPSKLTQFIKVVDGDVVVVNPGMLVRAATGGGSYAEFSVPLTRVGPSYAKDSGARSTTLNADNVCAEIYKL